MQSHRLSQMTLLWPPQSYQPLLNHKSEAHLPNILEYCSTTRPPPRFGLFLLIFSRYWVDSRKWRELESSKEREQCEGEACVVQLTAAHCDPNPSPLTGQNDPEALCPGREAGGPLPPTVLCMRRGPRATFKSSAGSAGRGRYTSAGEQAEGGRRG